MFSVYVECWTIESILFILVLTVCHTKYGCFKKCYDKYQHTFYIFTKGYILLTRAILYR